MPRYINKGRGERPKNGYSLTCDQTGCNYNCVLDGKKSVEYRMHAHKRKQHGIIDNSITYHLCNEELCTNRVFQNKWQLLRHKKQIHKIIEKQEEEYTYTVNCDLCTKIFRSSYRMSDAKRTMLFHKKKVHKIEDPACKFFVCREGECGELFPSNATRNRHEKICNGKKTERKYKCNYCNECLPFEHIKSLLQHIYLKHNISRIDFQQHVLLKYLLLQRFVQEINTVPISDGPGKKKRKNRKNRKKRVKKKQKL